MVVLIFVGSALCLVWLKKKIEESFIEGKLNCLISTTREYWTIVCCRCCRI